MRGHQPLPLAEAVLRPNARVALPFFGSPTALRALGSFLRDHARFGSTHDAEQYGWGTMAGCSPVLSVDADHQGGVPVASRTNVTRYCR
jgi:hypothetical protein